MEGHHTRQILIRAAASYHSQCFKLRINLSKTPAPDRRTLCGCRSTNAVIDVHPSNGVPRAILVAVSSISRRNSFLRRNQPMRSTPPRLTHTNHHPQSRGPATCPCDRVRRRSASASADGESLKSPPFFPVNTHRGRGGRIGQQSASRHPCIRLSASGGPDEGPNDVDQLGDVLIELSIPKLELKWTSDVSDLLIQIKDRGSGGLERRGRAMPGVMAVTKITALIDA